MKIALIGPELEENLALRCIHAAVDAAGHDARIFSFHAAHQIDELTEAIARYRPDIVGLSMVFTARAREFLDLAASLRRTGLPAHITAGGHFASFNAEPLLRDAPQLDSILHGEGEEALIDLADHPDDLPAVAGITARGPGGEPFTTPCREPVDNLDSRPWPTRSGEPQEYLGLPIANILSGRGCFGNCAFCSINAWHRRIGGRRFRQRRVDALAAEMAHLYHRRGIRIFNFHDDNFFLANHDANVRRFRAMRSALDGAGVKRIGIQVKARPDSIDGPTLDALKDLGLFRIFLGVESNAVAGLKALGRGIRREQNHRALELVKAAGVHVTFNLLMFEPDCTLGDLADNIDFIRAQSDVPQNSCGVVVYSGTPLEARLREQGRLVGDYFGYRYDIADPSCRTAYEIFREVFTPRNFFFEGMNLQAMSIDYNLHIARHFYPDRVGKGLIRRAKNVIRDINADNADLLEAICDFAAGCDPSDTPAVADFTERTVDRRVDFDARMAGRAEDILQAIRTAVVSRKGGVGVRAASLAAATVMAATVSTGGTQPTEMAPIDPTILRTLPAGFPHAKEMAPFPSPPATQPTSQPTTQPTSQPATQPADPTVLPDVEAYKAAEGERIQNYLNAHYRPALTALAQAYLKATLTQVPIKLTLGKDGRPVAFRIEMVGKQYDAFRRALRKQMLDWRVPKVKRAGSCTVTLTALRIPRDLPRTPPHEMAPRD